MTLRQFVRLFGLSAKILVQQVAGGNRWAGVVAAYEEISYDEAVKELQYLMNREGKGKARFYYIEAVRRRVLLARHEQAKYEPLPALDGLVQQILKGKSNVK